MQIKELEAELSKEIHSIEEYDRLVRLIENHCSAQTKNQYILCYRGDRYDTAVTAKIFSKKLLSQERDMFHDWKLNYCGKYCKESCEDKRDSIACLSAMQHYATDSLDCATRLLDFTTDPRIALRFACGNHCTKRKVTFYCAEAISLNENKDICDKFCDFINNEMSQEQYYQYAEILSKDYFLNIPYNFERIKRQKGLFLLMGNCEQLEKTNYNYEKKTHELSKECGRGVKYDGLFGSIIISEEAVNRIKEQLEENEKYSMKYLLSEN